ncbi:MAG: polysaccharide deacetylase family protein [Planctomycetota bacterium]
MADAAPLRKPRKGRLRRVALLLLLLGVALLPACGHLQVALLPVAEWIGPEGVYRFDVGDRRVMALTIDDGPSAHTDAILDLLAEHGHTATFFVHPDHTDALGPAGRAALQRILDEGHELGNHTAADVPSVRLPPEAFAASFKRADEALREFGVTPRWFRTAGGNFNPDTMSPLLHRYGYDPRFAMASFVPWDTFLHLPATYGRQLGARGYPGAILVLHEGIGEQAGRGERTMTTLRRLLEETDRRGYRLRTLSEVEAMSRE